MIFALTLSFKASSSNGITTLMPFSSLRDHPRGCGAHLLPQRRQLYCRGSPRWRCGPVTLPGIIPAGAGLTLSSIAATDSTRDHPRGCGAHFSVGLPPAPQWGSSPRVRGSLPTPFFRSLQAGIIPAGAGLTRYGIGLCRRRRDHPRGCGAHALYGLPCLPLRGSSPRVRGSLYLRGWQDLRRGIIPAGAGLTDCQLSRASGLRDHPRGCGAHTKKSQQLRHFPVLWLPESFTFKHSYRILHLVYSFVSAAT